MKKKKREREKRMLITNTTASFHNNINELNKVL